MQTAVMSQAAMMIAPGPCRDRRARHRHAPDRDQLVEMEPQAQERGAIGYSMTVRRKSWRIQRAPRRSVGTINRNGPISAGRGLPSI